MVGSLPHEVEDQLLDEVDEEEAGHQQNLSDRLLIEIVAWEFEMLADLEKKTNREWDNTSGQVSLSNNKAFLIYIVFVRSDFGLPRFYLGENME